MTRSGEHAAVRDPRRGTIPALDGLRAIAALLVLFSHSPKLTGMPVDDIATSYFWRFCLAGDMGVDLFFVLSGFLITSILVTNIRAPGALKVFWMRRVLRIFPLHYAYLAMIIVVAFTTHLFASGSVPTSAVGWLGFALYLSNFVLLARGDSALEIIILWSLAVEEQFYAVWPLIVRRHSNRELARFAIVAIALAPLIRLGSAVFVPNTDAFYVLPFCRMDSIFAGALVALERERIASVTRWAFWPAVATLVFLLQRKNYHEEQKPIAWITLYYSVLALAWAIVLCRTLDVGRIGKLLLANPAMTYVGKISYALYLFHPLLGRIIRATLITRLPPLALLGTHLTASLAAASISWVLLERPILRLKTRFPYTPA